MSYVSSMPEVAGDAAVYVDPYDVTTIREGLRKLAEEDALRETLRAAGFGELLIFRGMNAHKKHMPGMKRRMDVYDVTKKDTMKTLLLGGNPGFWRASERANDRHVMSGIEGWVFAMDGDHCDTLEALELIDRYDSIIGNTNFGAYRPKLLALQSGRAVYVWVIPLKDVLPIIVIQMKTNSRWL